MKPRTNRQLLQETLAAVILTALVCGTFWVVLSSITSFVARGVTLLVAAE